MPTKKCTKNIKKTLFYEGIIKEIYYFKKLAKIYFENEYGGARDKIEILKSINQ